MAVISKSRKSLDINSLSEQNTRYRQVSNNFLVFNTCVSKATGVEPWIKDRHSVISVICECICVTADMRLYCFVCQHYFLNPTGSFMEYFTGLNGHSWWLIRFTQGNSTSFLSCITRTAINKVCLAVWFSVSIQMLFFTNYDYSKSKLEIYRKI